MNHLRFLLVPRLSLKKCSGKENGETCKRSKLFDGIRIHFDQPTPKFEKHIKTLIQILVQVFIIIVFENHNNLFS